MNLPRRRRSISPVPAGIAYGCCLALAAAGPVAAAQSEIAPDEPAASSCDDESASCFRLLGLTIDGSEAFSPKELAPIYEPYLTQDVSTTELTLIASRITRRYLDEGYFLSQAIVPPQNTETGIARILVIEGRISKVEVRGDSASQVAPYVSGLPSQTIANLKNIDHRLALASDIPGVTLRASIEAVPDDPAQHHLVIETEFQSTEGQVLIDNRGTDAIGPLQAYGRFSMNSLFGKRDQLTLSGYTTPEDPRELTQLTGSYRYLFGGKSEVGLSYMRSEADGGFDIGAPNVGGNSEIGSIWYSRALKRSRSSSLWLDASFEAGHYENEWSNGGGFEDETRVGRVMLRGRLDSAGEATNILVRISAGLDALGASGQSVTERSRYDADASFTKLDFQVSHYRDLGRYFGVYAALAGQASADPLLLSEEFSAGGTRYGRAYSYGEISGEHGLGGTLEFRAGFDPGLDPISFLQGYAFYDAAQVWNENTPATADDLTLSSAGLGLRVDFLDWLTARVETAKPLDRTPFDADDRGWRQYFSLSASY